MSLNEISAIYEIDVLISSKNRNDYNTTNSNNFSITLDEPLRGYITDYALISAIIPNTIHNIQATTFQITDSVSNKNINFPAGNYDLTSLLSTLKTELDSQSDDTYTITNQDQIIQIQSTFNDFVLNPNSNENKLLYQIGFKSLSKTAIAGVLQGDFPINIKYPKYIFIKLNPLAQHIKNIDKLYNFMLDTPCGYNSLMYFDPPQQTRVAPGFLRIHNNQTFDVELRDEDNELLDLKNSDWSMFIKFNLQL